MPERRFIGIKECAEYLDIKEGTIYAWVHQRKVPYVKVGRLVKFDLRKLELWIKEREISPIEI